MNTATMETLSELARRAERAKPADEPVILVEAYWAMRAEHGDEEAFRAKVAAQAFESAAIMLVPPGHEWLVRTTQGQLAFANVPRVNASNSSVIFAVGQEPDPAWVEEQARLAGHNYGRAPTAGLALVAACLRAVVNRAALGC